MLNGLASVTTVYVTPTDQVTENATVRPTMVPAPLKRRASLDSLA
jgi:hypothetical protein